MRDAEPLISRPSCSTTNRYFFPFSYASRVAATASLSGLAFGVEVGLIDGVLAMDAFRIYMGTGDLNSEGIVIERSNAGDIDGWIVSSFLIGACLGSILVAWLADAYGRRDSIIFGGALFVVGGVIQTLSQGVFSLCFGRAVSGSGVGLLSSAGPLYITEAAETNVRGRLVATQQLMITVGIFLASSINAILLTIPSSEGQWRGALASQIIPGLAVLILVSFLPRSPRWLVAQGRHAEAAQVLIKLRAGNQTPLSSPSSSSCGDSIDNELKEIDKELAIENNKEEVFTCSVWVLRIRELFSKHHIRRARLVIAIQAFQQLTGINVILYFAADLIERAGGGSRAEAARSLVVGNSALLVIATLPALYLLDSSSIFGGRRFLLIIGAFLMSIAHACASFSLFFGGTGSSAISIISLFFFTATFSATWGPTAWVYTNEILPLRVRSQGAALGALVNWLVNAIVGKLSPLLIRISHPGTFCLLSIFCFTMGCWAYFFVPETAGRSLQDVTTDLWRDVHTVTTNTVTDSAVERVESDTTPLFIKSSTTATATTTTSSSE